MKQLTLNEFVKLVQKGNMLELNDLGLNMNIVKFSPIDKPIQFDISFNFERKKFDFPNDDWKKFRFIEKMSYSNESDEQINHWEYVKDNVEITMYSNGMIYKPMTEEEF